MSAFTKLNPDVVLAIFQSIPSTEEDLKRARMWSQTNKTFRDSFCRLVCDEEWMQPIKLRRSFIKKISKYTRKIMLASPAQKGLEERQIKRILRGIDAFAGDKHVLMKICRIIYQFICIKLDRRANNILVGNLGTIRKLIRVIDLHAVGGLHADNIQLCLMACETLHALNDESDRNKIRFIKCGGIESLAMVDAKYSLILRDDSSCAQSAIYRLLQHLPWLCSDGPDHGEIRRDEYIYMRIALAVNNTLSPE